MGKNDNFGNAMFEMFGVGKSSSESKKEVKQPAAKPVEQKTESSYKAPEKAFEPKEAMLPPKKAYSKTIIAEGTAFEGNITSKGDVDVAGDFKGNIYSEGKVVLFNRVDGNIKANNLTIAGCELVGDVNVSGIVEMDQNAFVTGNIVAENIVCSGKVTGDLDIKEGLTLADTAIINGNIKMSTMSVAKGAKVTGKLEMQA